MLSDALESGNFFAEEKNQKEKTQEAKSRKEAETSQSPDREKRADQSHDREENAGQTKKNEKISGRRQKKLSPAEQSALKTLGLDENTSLEEAKKAYREKLKYYHPDRHGDNPVLQKVAREKTRLVLESWEILSSFFEK
ncbi:MAG: DnaJ domain-containing protein [Treponema sp.]|nr:DnaJ domain-containing protein [Treponema sp.]